MIDYEPFHIDPERENDDTALSDAEVFQVSHFVASYNRANADHNEYALTEPGCYWHSCFPGCLPDGEPMGPFESKEEAIADARNE